MRVPVYAVSKRTRRAPRFVVAVVYVARVCQGYASWCLGVQNQLAYFLTIGTSGDCLNRPLSCPIARSACGPPDRAQFSLKEFYRENFKFQNSSKTMSKPSDDDNKRITLFSDRWNGSRTPGFLKFKRDFATGAMLMFSLRLRVSLRSQLTDSSRLRDDGRAAKIDYRE